MHVCLCMIYGGNLQTKRWVCGIWFEKLSKVKKGSALGDTREMMWVDLDTFLDWGMWWGGSLCLGFVEVGHVDFSALGHRWNMAMANEEMNNELHNNIH